MLECIEKKNFEKAVVTSNSKSENVIKAAMQIVYTQAKEHLATRKCLVLKELCIDLGCPSLTNLNVDNHTSYESYDSIHDMEEAISKAICDNIVDKIKKSRWFSVMIDESTDVSVIQNMIVYIKVVNKGQMFTHFLELVPLSGCTAPDLYECVIKTLNKYEIDVSNCSSIATDGASVMTGVRAGVSALFKKDHPQMLSIHCVAHRLALAVSQAAGDIPYLVKYQNLLNKMYSYFEQSPKNTDILKTTQKLLNEPRKKFVQTFATRWLKLLNELRKKFVQTFATRWLSFGSSVDSVSLNWRSLVALLQTDTRPLASGILKQITKFQFVATTAFLKDVMFLINILCLTFQKPNIDFSSVQSAVETCLLSLREILDVNGPNLKSFIELEEVPTNASEGFNFQETFVSDSEKQRSEFSADKSKFLQTLNEHLYERLGDFEKIYIFNVLIPNNIIDCDKNEDYGIKEISSLLSSSSYGFDETDILSEWNVFKKLIKSRCKGKTFPEMLLFMHNNELWEGLPLLKLVVEYAATIPLHTVDCERGFSYMNLVKTDLRNRLNVANLNTLLMISIDGPERKDFRFDEAFKHWCLKKQRRIQV